MSDALQSWLERHKGLVQERKVSLADAEAKVRLAERNAERARRNLAEDDRDPDQALVNAETAIVNAADAVLARDGYRLRGKTGAHQARLEYPLLPGEFAAEHARLAHYRTLRSAAMYDAPDMVSEEEAREAVVLAERLIRAAKRALAKGR